MPGHFLVKYESDRYKIFVDCFNGGALLTEKNCQRFLTEAGYGFDEKYLQQSPVRAILSRMIKNLLGHLCQARRSPQEGPPDEIHRNSRVRK